MLEENQLVVQGMMASKYLATFEAEVTSWQKKLANVSEALGQMSEVQRKWAYLETLFIGSDEVKRELPESTKRFDGVNKTFVSTCKTMHKTKNAVAACATDGLLPALEEMGTGLEACEKARARCARDRAEIAPTVQPARAESTSQREPSPRRDPRRHAARTAQLPATWRRTSPSSSSRSGASSRASTSSRRRCSSTSSPTATGRGSSRRTSTRSSRASRSSACRASPRRRWRSSSRTRARCSISSARARSS